MRTSKLIAVSVALIIQVCSPVEIASATPTWTEIYRTTTSYRNGNNITYVGGYERGGLAVTNFSNSGKVWDVIRIRMQATKTSDSTIYYTDVYFDKWAGATLTGLEFPDLTNTNTIQRNVSNLVVSSNYSGVNQGSFALGRLEWWPYNYATSSAAGMSPTNPAGTYDWDDSFSASGDHGSFQVHNLTDTQTVLAWNMHRSTGTQEIGFGSAPVGSNPDWTGTNSVFNNSGFMVQVFVGLKVTAGTIAAPSYSGVLKKGIKTTLTTITNGPGKVTFYYQGKRIAGCINRVAIDVSGTLTATCNFSPPSSGRGSVYAKYYPSDSGYTAATSPVITTQVVRRTNLR